ncbi:hypothetical protein SeLEV6574_g02620 [Synchytrium endobioticum]|uniref:DH domain-containing protein n=1 Tax=Synchytrium endobioticum TaxID=286115 RepID=A0A507D895_9FUNG|nr:hypothetical protein SeLEV6574_g02620 [Synchytrium endobioticum]
MDHRHHQQQSRPLQDDQVSLDTVADDPRMASSSLLSSRLSRPSVQSISSTESTTTNVPRLQRSSSHSSQASHRPARVSGSPAIRKLVVSSPVSVSGQYVLNTPYRHAPVGDPTWEKTNALAELIKFEKLYMDELKSTLEKLTRAMEEHDEISLKPIIDALSNVLSIAQELEKNFKTNMECYGFGGLSQMGNFFQDYTANYPVFQQIITERKLDTQMSLELAGVEVGLSLPLERLVHYRFFFRRMLAVSDETEREGLNGLYMTIQNLCTLAYKVVNVEDTFSDMCMLEDELMLAECKSFEDTVFTHRIALVLIKPTENFPMPLCPRKEFVGEFSKIDYAHKESPVSQEERPFRLRRRTSVSSISEKEIICIILLTDVALVTKGFPGKRSLLYPPWPITQVSVFEHNTPAGEGACTFDFKLGDKVMFALESPTLAQRDGLVKKLLELKRGLETPRTRRSMLRMQLSVGSLTIFLNT